MNGNPAWRTSSRTYANGNCVEVAPAWRKATASIACGDCIEVADWRTATASGDTECVEVASGVRVRDSKQPEGTVLTFAPGAWRAAIATWKGGAA